MSINEMNGKVQELRELRRMADELRRMADELQAEIEALQDAIKEEMTARNTDEISGTDWRITWKNVTSNRIDTTALKKAMPEIAAQFTKPTASRRFVLA